MTIDTKGKCGSCKYYRPIEQRDCRGVMRFVRRGRCGLYKISVKNHGTPVKARSQRACSHYIEK